MSVPVSSRQQASTADRYRNSEFGQKALVFQGFAGYVGASERWPSGRRRSPAKGTESSASQAEKLNSPQRLAPHPATAYLAIPRNFRKTPAMQEQREGR